MVLLYEEALLARGAFDKGVFFRAVLSIFFVLPQDLGVDLALTCMTFSDHVEFSNRFRLPRNSTS
jgi:hypothetical protein